MIPAGFAPILFGFILSGLMSAIVSEIAGAGCRIAIYRAMV
jgi:hypothetical protein